MYNIKEIFKSLLSPFASHTKEAEQKEDDEPYKPELHDPEDSINMGKVYWMYWYNKKDKKAYFGECFVRATYNDNTLLFMTSDNQEVKSKMSMVISHLDVDGQVIWWESEDMSADDIIYICRSKWILTHEVIKKLFDTNSSYIEKNKDILEAPDHVALEVLETHPTIENFIKYYIRKEKKILEKNYNQIDDDTIKQHWIMDQILKGSIGTFV